jgi:hypothetical protein
MPIERWFIHLVKTWACLLEFGGSRRQSCKWARTCSEGPQTIGHTPICQSMRPPLSLSLSLFHLWSKMEVLIQKELRGGEGKS